MLHRLLDLPADIGTVQQKYNGDLVWILMDSISLVATMVQVVIGFVLRKFRYLCPVCELINLEKLDCILIYRREIL